MVKYLWIYAHDLLVIIFTEILKPRHDGYSTFSVLYLHPDQSESSIKPWSFGTNVSSEHLRNS